MANTVTLTIAGNPQPAQDAFRRVGDASQDMGRRVEGSADSFDRAADRADAVDTKAMGFRDTLTGIQDSALGVKRAASGDWGFETLLLLGTGIGDLASGLVNFLIPALKGTKIAQLGLNMAFLTSPITWIIVGIVALIAVIVLIATKTDWFQRAWKASWTWIKQAAAATWNWLKQLPGWIGSAFARVANFISQPYRLAWRLVSQATTSAWNFIKTIPGRVLNAYKNVGLFILRPFRTGWNYISKIPGWTSRAFGGISRAISAPFRAAFNGISSAWNNTVGRLSWSVPGWVPGIGGNSISVPNLPHFHSGGVVPGTPGSEVLAVLQAGERVQTRGGGGGGPVIEIRSGGTRLDELLVEMLRLAIARKGGNVLTVLGGRRG